jgi:hypothetical protein
MEVIEQSLDEVLASLQVLEVDWQDDVARRVIERLRHFPVKKKYTDDDIRAIFDSGPFADGQLIARLFLGLSKDQFQAALISGLGEGGTGVTRYKETPGDYIAVLVGLGLLKAMGAELGRTPHWSDTLVERLRSGRGSAISGQRRGRDVEDFAQGIVRAVFGENFTRGKTFTGKSGLTAKSDFAIPSDGAPRILIEAKGYGATGSKMTDVIGDIEKIIKAKRSDTTFLLFTDGVTWAQRQSDLRAIVKYQNNGDIARIYTYAMAGQFQADLEQLKQEYRIPGSPQSNLI